MDNEIIKALFLDVFNSNEDIALDAAKKIEQLLKAISAKALIHLDKLMRDSYPGPITKLLTFPNPIPLLGLSSFSYSGFIREEALWEISAYRTGEEVKYLLLRLNDWVPEVRGVAKKAVLNRITPDYMPYFIEHFDLVRRMYSWHRADHKEVLELIEHTFNSSKELVLYAVKHPSTHVRRQAIRMATAIPLIEFSSIIASDPDPMVRLIYVSIAKKSLEPDQRHKLIEIFKNDRSVRVRREILLFAIDNESSDLTNLLENALSDANLWIREISRWAFFKKGVAITTIQEHYRRRLLEDPYQIGLILGLGEVGDETDVERLIPLLDDENLKVRKAAFYAIAKIKPVLLKDIALVRIQDNFSDITKQAKSFILKHREYYLNEEIWEVFETTLRKEVKLMVLSLIHEMPKWSRLIYLLKAGEDPSQEIREAVLKGVQSWINGFNSSFLVPSEKETASIKALINKSSLSNVDKLMKII